MDTKITVGEFAVDGERHPQVYLRIGRKRYRIATATAHRFGLALMDAARSTVSRVDLSVLREVVAECEITPL